MIDNKILKEKIVADLKTIKPEKVVLFGSLQTGQFKEGESDIDLLIIKNTNKRPADRYSEARLLLTSDYPFDIFVLTKKELDEKINSSFFSGKLPKKVR